MSTVNKICCICIALMGFTQAGYASDVPWREMVGFLDKRVTKQGGFDSSFDTEFRDSLSKSLSAAFSEIGIVSVETRKDLITIFDLIDLYNEVLDTFVATGSVNEVYFSRWDTQSKILVAFQAWLQTLTLDQSANNVWPDIRKRIRHPYTQLICMKADLARPNTERLFLNEANPFGFDFRTKERLEESFFERLDAGVYYSKRDRSTARALDAWVQSRWGWASDGFAVVAAFQYRASEYSVALNRFLIEMLSDTIGFRSSAIDERRYLYSGLSKSVIGHLKSALTFRYGISDPDINPLPIESIVALDEKIHLEHLGDALSIRADKAVVIPPGIYRSNQHLVIQAETIEFSPLAVIFAPGKNILLNAERLVQPWVDVSGDPESYYHGNPAGSITIQVALTHGEILGSVLLVAMGGVGRSAVCSSEFTEPSCGGNGGRVHLIGGSPLLNFKTILSFPGFGGTLNCRACTVTETSGSAGQYFAPLYSPRKGREGL